MYAVQTRVTAQPERARIAIATKGANLRASMLAAERLLAERHAHPRAQEDRIGDSAFVNDVHRTAEELLQNSYP